jgi:hypothetical protein
VRAEDPRMNVALRPLPPFVHRSAVALPLWLAAALLVPGHAQQPPPAAPAAPTIAGRRPAPRDGECCPPGRWYTQGGNAARNASSANRALLRQPLVAWRVPVGPLFGEPLVWDEHVVLGTGPKPGRRGVEVRRLADGSLVGEARVLNGDAAPCPTVWGNEIVWRVGSTSLELLRIVGKRLERVTAMPKAKDVGPPLRFGAEVYAVVDGFLCAMRAGDFRVLWKSAQGGLAGRPSMLGNSLFAMRAVAPGWAPVEFDRSTGKAIATGPTIPIERFVADDAQLVLADQRLLLLLGPGPRLTSHGDADLNAVQFSRPLDPAAEYAVRAMPIAPALDGRCELAAIEAGVAKRLGLFTVGSDKGLQLDTHESHKALVEPPPTIVDGAFYFGSTAADATEHRILWRMPAADRALPVARAIPAGDHLLLAGNGELVALREDTPPDTIAAELSTDWLARQRTALQGFVDASMKTADAELPRDLLARCRDLQVDEAWVQKRDKELAARKKDPKAKVDRAEIDRVRAAADAVATTTLADVAAQVAGWATGRSPLDHRRGLRFVLDHEPAHAGTAAQVRALLPAGLKVPEPFAAVDWLDFACAAAHTEVAFLEASLDDFAVDTQDAITRQNKQQLLEWRSKWRPDLQALRSDRLLLFSPITRPGSLARALATGELVCDTLEAMFAGMPAVRSDPRPMLLFIYPDRDEYLAEAKKTGFESLEWTAGFYSDGLNELVAKSRMFVPDDELGFAGVLPTLAHELTHQWLMDRCPAFRPKPLAARMGRRAFWIVEGFAGLVEQFAFDFVRQKASLVRGNLIDADVVVSARHTLIPWDDLVAMSRAGFDVQTRDPQRIQVPSSLCLGRALPVSLTAMFYAQSAMLCRYLYEAEGGVHRQALLEYVAAYYTGAQQDLGFEDAFGVKAKELGPKVVEFAQGLLF